MVPLLRGVRVVPVPDGAPGRGRHGGAVPGPVQDGAGDHLRAVLADGVPHLRRGAAQRVDAVRAGSRGLGVRCRRCGVPRRLGRRGGRRRRCGGLQPRRRAGVPERLRQGVPVLGVGGGEAIAVEIQPLP